MLKTSRDEGTAREHLRMQQFFHPSSFSQTTMIAAVRDFDFFAKRCLKKQPSLCAASIKILPSAALVCL